MNASNVNPLMISLQKPPSQIAFAKMTIASSRGARRLIFVEGSKDVEVFRKFYDQSEISFRSSVGRSGVFEVVNKLSNQPGLSPFGIIDADNDLILGFSLKTPPVFATDYRDLESTIFMTSCGDSVLNENLTDPFPAKLGQTLTAFKSRVIYELAKIGACRIVNAKFDLGLNFKRFEIGAYIDSSLGVIDERRFMEHLTANIPPHKQKIFQSEQAEILRLCDPKKLVHGHDLSIYLAIMKNTNYYKNFRGRPVEAEDVETSLRVSFVSEVFVTTQLAIDLRKHLKLSA
jgi:hypothetical protein